MKGVEKCEDERREEMAKDINALMLLEAGVF